MKKSMDKVCNILILLYFASVDGAVLGVIIGNETLLGIMLIVGFACASSFLVFICKE